MAHPEELVRQRLEQNTWSILGQQGYVLGVDLGGYGLRAALIDLHTNTFTSATTPVQQTEPQPLIEEALNMVNGLLQQNHIGTERLVRVGVGFGGPVDPQQGIIRLSPRMSGWENFPLKDHFEQAFDTVTVVDNDANLIALSEAVFGVGRPHRHLFYLHLSSGVGGGIVINERLYHGATATAGEIGHAVVRQSTSDFAAAPTLEELVSISGILRRARYAGFETDNLHDIFSDHPIGQRVVRETVDLLAMHLAQVVALLDPQMIVLGGIVVRIGGQSFVENIGRQIRRYIDPQFARPVEVVSSALGIDSVAIGALALALESMSD
jgi:glucokinase